MGSHVFAGLRGTGDFGDDERPKSFREMILWLNPNGRSPLTALMSKMRSERVTDPEFSWWEESLTLVRVETDAEANDSATTISLDSGALQLVRGDVLLVEKDDDTDYTNEIVEVSETPSGDGEIAVSRGVADTTAATIPSGAFLTRIGTSFAEGTGSPDVSQRNPKKQHNFCQIFKTAYELTETVKETTFRTGDAKQNDRRRKSFDHAVSMELAWLYGRAYETTGDNGKPKRYTGGLRQFIRTNNKVFDPSATSGKSEVTEDNFLDFVHKVFDHEGDNGGSDERLVLAGNEALNTLNKLARDSNSTRINFDGIVETYGMRLQRWIVPQGAFYVRTHPLLNTHGRYSSSMFIVDPANLVYRYLRDTKDQQGIQANDEDVEKGQWLTECGMELHHEKTMAFIGRFKKNG